MRKLALAVAAVIAVMLPVAADAAPKHHDHSVTQRAIDWD